MNRPGIRSLRARMRVLAVGAAILPLVGVLAAPLGDRLIGWQLTRRVESALSEVASGADAASAATRWRVRVRHVSPDGSVDRVEDMDDPFGPLLGPLAALLGVPPPLRLAEVSPADHPPPPPATVACEPRGNDAVEVCEAGAVAPDGGAWAVDGSARRRIIALWEDRLAVAEVCGFCALVGLAWASWWGRRLVRDVEIVAAAAADRASRSGRIPPLPETGPAELVTVSRALNHLLAAREARAESQARRAADLAHELRGVAATVRSAAEALQAEGAGPQSPRTARLSRALDTASHRLDTAIASFLALARAEAGLPGEQRADVALGDLARGLASIRPGVVVHGDGAVIHGVPDALESVLANLLDNARSFAGPEGRVDVTLGAHSVSVEDSGPGVPPDIADQIFEPWFTTRPHAGGTGLGLALARAIVEAHGGTLTLTLPNRFEVRFTPDSQTIPERSTPRPPPTHDGG